MADTDLVLNRLSRLLTVGVHLAVDDFGTGYSSLSILKRLPVDSLKVDRSFVEGLPDDEEDRAITSLVVAMGRSLNYRVVVEGVETAEQVAFLTVRSEEHTSELQSRGHLVCRLLLEKK